MWDYWQCITSIVYMQAHAKLLSDIASWLHAETQCVCVLGGQQASQVQAYYDHAAHLEQWAGLVGQGDQPVNGAKSWRLPREKLCERDEMG